MSDDRLEEIKGAMVGINVDAGSWARDMNWLIAEVERSRSLKMDEWEASKTIAINEMAKQIKSLQSQLAGVKHDLKLQEQDNDRIIYCSKAAVETMKKKLSAAEKRCEEFADIALGNAQEISVMELKLRAVEKEKEKLHAYIQGRWMAGDAVKNLLKLEAENAELREHFETSNKAVADLTQKLTASEKEEVKKTLNAELKELTKVLKYKLNRKAEELTASEEEKAKLQERVEEWDASAKYSILTCGGCGQRFSRDIVHTCSGSGL